LVFQPKTKLSFLISLSAGLVSRGGRNEN